jgi:hypothetical protein
MESKRFYKVLELSEITKIPRSSLYAAIQRGEIKAVTLGRGVYVPTAEARRLMGEPVEVDAGGEQGSNEAA